MKLIAGLVIFCGAFIYVKLVDSFALTPVAILRSLVIPMIILLIILYRTSTSSWKSFFAKRGKWFLLFWGTVLIQLLTISTGGIESPFLIHIHLFMVGISFAFGFSISLFFLLASVILIYFDTIRDHQLMLFLINSPQVVILQLASILPIVAVAYIISQQYHVKDMLSKMLGEQVKTDAVILEHINELIIVTDPDLNILSVNEAVERTLQQSKSEMLNKELFKTLLIKTSEGKLINKEYFFPDGKHFDKQKKYIESCEVVNASSGSKHFAMLIQPIEDAENKVSQISFVLSYGPHSATDSLQLDVSIERSRAKYEARIAMLKNKMVKNDTADAVGQLVLLDNIESDLFTIQSLKNDGISRNTSKIDIAKLCKETVQVKQDFAKIFQVPVTFELQNFGYKDIAPLTVKNYEVKPDELTGPFFTVECDVQKVGLLIKKLIDLVVTLASSESKGQVHLSVEPKEQEVIIKIFSNCPAGLEEEMKDIYAPYYGRLATKTNLQAGSGLEGYLTKVLSESLDLSVNMEYNSKAQSTLVFTTTLKKKQLKTS